MNYLTPNIILEQRSLKNTHIVTLTKVNIYNKIVCP